MPWRTDFVECFWLDPDWVGLSGYPDQKAPTAEALASAAPRHVTRSYHKHSVTAAPQRPIAAAVIAVRDRIGFRYEREVGLDDFVSVREAAQLLDLPIMTLTRWVKRKVLKSSRKRGFAVIPVREVLRMATERKRKLKLGSRLVVIG
ncbi:MAG TPA: helix-turn-helix domain-containing protein [Gemmatimonadales bacterium]|nr:helix-turn-helix domain-containing protein [Gemmatimonadales bacterium]